MDPQKKKQRSESSVGNGIRAVFRSIGSLLLTLIMVGIITGCIVACVLTVYILQAMGAEEPIDLESLELGYTSIILAVDKDGKEVELERLYNPENNRIWIDLDQMNDYTKQAIVAIEDKRFYQHSGVDWKRTIGSFINLFVPIYDSQAGGSTIHQQVIKNVTGDNDLRIDRKVREIFRALNLAETTTKDQVLEAYLNIVPFGAGVNGIQAAANVYFGKDAKDLTLAESASIVGITKMPTAYNPLINPDKNKQRQEIVLHAMHDQGFISDEEYEKALKEPLNFQKNNTFESVWEPTSYFVDHIINTVIDDFVEQKGMTRAEASHELYQGGYRIYTTIDTEIQSFLEDFYSTTENFPSINRAEYPQSACVITDHHGKILALVGGIGPKTESRSFNRATMAKRQPGSTFKPIGPYALAFEYNRITPSTIIQDSPTNPDDPPSKWWPHNYYPNYLGPVTVERAIKNSINTVAVKVAQTVGTQTLFDFYFYDLNMTSLVASREDKNGNIFSDIAIAPMALGGVTDGVTPLELTGAYQILVNGGTFTKPYAYTKVVASDGHIVLQTDTTARRVISEDTAVLLNKMTQEVVRSGTGTLAQIPNMPTGGKTGTSDLDVDQWFVGYSPYYICNVWLGYDEPNTYNKYGNLVKNSVLYAPYPYPTPPLFKSIMTPIHEGLESIPFLDSPDVVQKGYCTVTGDLAGPGCPTATTWYKASNLPPTCSGVHVVADPETDAPNKDGSSTTDNKGKEELPDTIKPSPPVTSPDVDGDINIPPAA